MTRPAPTSDDGDPGVRAKRRRIVALLTVLSFVSYLERSNISVAAKFIMPEFGLTQIQMGLIFSSFLIAYTILQIPAGIFGDVRGHEPAHQKIVDLDFVAAGIHFDGILRHAGTQVLSIPAVC